MAMVFSMGLGIRAEVRAIEEESFCRELHDDYKRKEEKYREKIEKINEKKNKTASKYRVFKEFYGELENLYRYNNGESEELLRRYVDYIVRKKDEKINRLNKKENLIKEAIGFLEKNFRKVCPNFVYIDEKTRMELERLVQEQKKIKILEDDPYVNHFFLMRP